MTTESQRKATAKWQASRTKSVSIRFTPNSMDAYDHLSKQGNKAGYLIDLIRKDMER